MEGFCSTIAGLLGCGHATTTYGGNIGAIGVTRVSVLLFGPRRDKTYLGVSDKASFKSISSATETREIVEISLVGSLHTLLSKKRITKALISLRGCAGWSAPLLFANLQRQVFSRRCSF